MSIGKIMSKIVKALPKTEGAAGKITLGRTQLEALGKKDKKTGELIQKALNGLKDPKLDVAYKAESNYAIAGMRLRDGKQVLNQGAVSITNPGTSQAVVKYHVSADGGKTLQANGFIDAGKAADGKDIAVGMSRKGGKVTADFSTGQATRHHMEFDEQKGVELARQLDAQNLLLKYTQATNNLQRNLDRMMVDTRQVLSGRVEGGLEKVKRFDPTEMLNAKAKTVKSFDGKIKQADIPHFNKNAVVDKTFAEKFAKTPEKFSKEETKAKVLKEAKMFNLNKTKPNFD